VAKKKPSRKGNVPPPKCKAILLCERTIIEAGTGKISLIDLFDGFIVPQVPGVTGPFTIYVVCANQQEIDRQKFGVTTLPPPEVQEEKDHD
jgi:hypothetical protein